VAPWNAGLNSMGQWVHAVWVGVAASKPRARIWHLPWTGGESWRGRTDEVSLPSPGVRSCSAWPHSIPALQQVSLHTAFIQPQSAGVCFAVSLERAMSTLDRLTLISTGEHPAQSPPEMGPTQNKHF
jgi:hypothetical protein